MKKWILKYKGKIEESEFSKKLNISPEICQNLKHRGICTEKD
ncbi:hypothetical protein [Clostridioides difficile]|nr:hypothetical protein [Clostridioides difficile]MDX5634006.1 hypothetical protein [Clostridioides difficile]